jgi:Family of unknown function (DUF5681)
MSHRSKKPPGDYPVGYGRPPSHTRFRKGVSGNPRGRPRGMTVVRANRLALQEAYRLIPVREGDVVFTLPTIQALMRQLARLAAKGNGPALRMFIKMIQTIEQEKASEAEIKEEELAERAPVSDQDRARALAAFMAKVGMKVSLPD